jgi:hypothetical protein
MPFEWDHAKELAAQLFGESRFEVEEIAVKCGVTRQTLWNWRQVPEFQARVAERFEEIRAEIRRHGIAITERRVARVQDTWRRLQRVVDARAIEYAGVPGGDTGLLVRKYKMLGSGPLAEKVEEYEVDTSLLAELRAHEKQAAEELGQWIQKADVTSDGQSITRGFETVRNERDGTVLSATPAVGVLHEPG